MASNKTQELLMNLGIFSGLALGGWYAYQNNFFGIKNLIDGMGGTLAGLPSSLGVGGGAGLPPPPIQQTPTTVGAPFSPTGSVPNLSGFETGYSPGGGAIPGGAPGIDYTSAMYDSPFGTPSIDPRTGIDYSLYYPPTGVGTLGGTNPSPYPNPCLPGYYRASDLKCYPIPTQFPGNGCGTGMYLANDGRCYPYPTGAAGGGYGPGGGGVGGAGGGYAPTPCPLGEYRASDGRCYALPTPPPEVCPSGAYRASDGKCYPITPGQTVGDCPAGFTKGSDGVCRASTVCPAGYTMGTSGVCVPSTTQCPAGYTLVNGVCTTQPTGGNCPAGYILQGGVCVPAPIGSPLGIPLGPLMLIKPLPPGVSPSQFCKSCINREEFGRVDTTFWAGVMLRPELSGGIPQYAVIIKAEDSLDYRDALKIGFIPLTPDHLVRYIPATGSFYVGQDGEMRRFSRRVLNRYR
jgi:hypothetical protein